MFVLYCSLLWPCAVYVDSKIEQRQLLLVSVTICHFDVELGLTNIAGVCVVSTTPETRNVYLVKQSMNNRIHNTRRIELIIQVVRLSYMKDWLEPFRYREQ